jgi:hypothetical protein
LRKPFPQKGAIDLEHRGILEDSGGQPAAGAGLERVAIVDFTSPAREHRAVNSVDLIVSSVLPSLHVRASQLFA